MHCLVSESSVQCAFLELWTYLDKSLLQSKFFQHLIFYVHCTLCRIKVAIAMEWEKISDLRPAWVAIWTLWPRWLWLAMSLCSGAIWPRWRFVAFVAQFFHIANLLSRLRIWTQEGVWAFWLGASMMPLPFALMINWEGCGLQIALICRWTCVVEY